MEKVTLFYLERPDIKISMQIYFTERKASCTLMAMISVKPLIMHGEIRIMNIYIL